MCLSRQLTLSPELEVGDDFIDFQGLHHLHLRNASLLS